MSATEQRSVLGSAVVRDVVEQAVRADGFKRGLFRAASMLGVTERWLKAVRYGEPAAVDADTYLRALEARQALLRERQARLAREIAEIEAAIHADAAAPPVRLSAVGRHDRNAMVGQRGGDGSACAATAE